MKLLTIVALIALLDCGDDAPTDAGADVGLVDAGSDAGSDASADSDAGPDELCVELTQGDPTSVDLAHIVRVSVADVVFLMDVSASMGEEVERIQDTLRTEIAPALASTIEDLNLAVAEFSDFPETPYGSTGDVPFRLLQASTEDVGAIEGALAGLTLRDGADIPESQITALFQIASGAGLGGYVAPAECPGQTVGFPCFRPHGSRIVVLFTDAEMHEGPGGHSPYDSIIPAPPTYEQTIDALRSIGARVVGVYSGEPGLGRDHLRQVARDTGAVTADDNPITVDIGTRGDGLDEGVVSVIQSLVEDATVDVDVLLEDVAGDAHDALDFVSSVQASMATPEGGAVLMGDRFSDVRAGTELHFRLVLQNESVAPTTNAQSAMLNVVFRGDGVTRLAERSVRIVIPSISGDGCE